jgi:hypothetical protein
MRDEAPRKGSRDVAEGGRIFKPLLISLRASATSVSSTLNVVLFDVRVGTATLVSANPATLREQELLRP